MLLEVDKNAESYWELSNELSSLWTGLTGRSMKFKPAATQQQEDGGEIELAQESKSLDLLWLVNSAGHPRGFRIDQLSELLRIKDQTHYLLETAQRIAAGRLNYKITSRLPENYLYSVFELQESNQDQLACYYAATENFAVSSAGVTDSQALVSPARLMDERAEVASAGGHLIMLSLALGALELKERDFLTLRPGSELSFEMNPELFAQLRIQNQLFADLRLRFEGNLVKATIEKMFV